MAAFRNAASQSAKLDPSFFNRVDGLMWSIKALSQDSRASVALGIGESVFPAICYNSIININQILHCEKEETIISIIIDLIKSNAKQFKRRLKHLNN
jgi:hypothetical protein